MIVPSRTLENRTAQRVDTAVCYTVSGPVDGPTVVLVHGWACNRSDYDELTGFLPGEYRVLAVDLAEHGDSRSSRELWTMQEFARDVQAVLEAEAVDRCVVVGHSLGGAVAVEVARLLPDVVTRVIALDALHYLFLFGALNDEQAAPLLQTVRDDFPGLVRSMVEAGSPAGTDATLMQAYFDKMVAVRQPAGAHAFEGLVAWNMEDTLRDVHQPITIFGVRDLVAQEAIDRLGDRMDMVLVDLGSHHFPTEAPQATAGLIAGVVGS